MYPQGINMYAPHRFTSDMWCAWLSITSLGKNPYTDDLQRTANGFLDYRLSDGTFFGAGDGVRQKKISPNIMYSMAIGAAIYGDPTLRGAVLQFYNGNISSLNKETATTVFSLVHHTILGAEYFAKHGSTKAFNLNETRKAVRYHSYPIGEMITEERPNDLNSPASFMFIGEKSTANHDHADAGTFQLSYKDLQFVDAGVYDKYGSAHWRYYHQATIGHNGLLFFDPSRVQDEMEDGNFANPKTLDGYFYSGGQRNFYNSGFNFEEWLNSEETNTAKVMSHGYRLRTDGTCDFAYIAGDITSAYTPSQVSRVERKMLTLYTSDKKRTMHFVVYDSADLASPQIVSKFLFHTPVEPHIDNKRKKVSFIKNETKLELFALLGTDKIESLGGEGAEYLINGKQCAEAKTKPDGMWGRIELSSTGKTTQEFLNVMSFASLDADKLMPEVLDGDNYKGVLLDGVAVIFAKGNKFPVLNIKCAKRYIILGLADGEYSISLGNGSSSKYTCASGAIVINL